ncbi:centromere/kinetochore zw10 domain-containing protein [Phthorimaea operculella]|nr:centromere/kinetochore zw10 domain-containing protein [Phthorimaea operculella]
MTENKDATKEPDAKALDDEALEKLAVEELMREAVQGAARAEIVGPSGWVKSQPQKTNKRFLVNTLRNADYDVEEVLRTIFDSKDVNWKPAEKISLITKEIEQLKSDLKLYLGNAGFNLESIVKEGKELREESQALVDDMRSCKQEIEEQTMAEILKSVEMHDKLGKELDRVNFAINIIYDVVQCGRYVKDFEEARGIQGFSTAVESITSLMQLLEFPSEGFRKMDLYSNIRNTAQIIVESLYQDMFSEWDRLVSWNVKPCTKKTTVTITLNLENDFASCDLLNALAKSKQLDEKIKEFGQLLLKEVLIPIIQKDCTVFAETDELMTVTIYHKPNFKPPYDAVISNLRLLFHYLSNKLKIEYTEANGSIHTVMSAIGGCIGNEFRCVLVKDCLLDTIPYNINDLQTYGKITAEICDFEDFLNIIKLSPEGRFSILGYLEHIDLLFSAKSSQHYLETARTIMMKDLSQTMSIGVESIPDDEQNTVFVEGDAEEALKILDQTIPKSLFYFPRCMISKTAQELLDLVHEMMEQAVQCSDVVSKKLYQTTRLVFELYDAVVPYHHEKYLQTIPQYVALFHNNCMYLAHNLLTFGDKWLMLMEGRELDYPISFLDLVQKLRDLGYKHLTVHMQQQRKQILDNVRSSVSWTWCRSSGTWVTTSYKHLTVHMQQQRKQILDNVRSSDLNSIAVKDVLGDNAEAAVRQCLRQLQLLKNVWIGVFPINVFTRLMGTLANMFVDELIHRVCCAEDVSAEMATQLADIYNLVVQKIPVLFQSPQDVETHVKTWPKLRELIFVLGGTLKDIEAHWGEGAGPLAVHFRTDELRNLIKALFQNTQFRANLLSKIKRFIGIEG